MMRAIRNTAVLNAAALMMCTLAASADAQERANSRAPVIHLYSRDGGLATNYLQPAIEVSEDAYVFAVSMDLDGQIQVLHPDYPGISVRIRARRQLQLPNFFVGFSQPSGTRYTGFGNAAFSGYDYEITDTRGTVIALASREPFHLELLERGGDWNIDAIRRLIENRTPDNAARNLARAIGVRGEPIGHDYLRFAGDRRNAYGYGSYALSSCDTYYGYAYGGLGAHLAQLQAVNRVLYLQRLGQPVSIVGYDLCGVPIISYGRLAGPALPYGHFPRTRPPSDTTVFPKGRFPAIGVIPRSPNHPGTGSAFENTIPRSGPANPAQLEDVTITPPRSGPPRTDPANGVERFHPESSGSRPFPSTQSGRPARSEPVVAAPTTPDYRSEPRASFPSPSQGSFPREPVREPAPVAPPPRIIHEAPVQREAPPPRIAPPPVTSPAPAPPPRSEPTTPPPRT